LRFFPVFSGDRAILNAVVAKKCRQIKGFLLFALKKVRYFRTLAVSTQGKAGSPLILASAAA
jgi:hypothetical protein